MKTVTMAFVAALLIPVAGISGQTSIAPGGSSDAPQTRLERLEPFSPQVTATFNRLHSPLTRAQRLAIYGPLSSSMKSAVWIHQFELALEEHPEYTPEQRLVLEEAIALATPEVFEISNDSPEWRSRVDQPLQEFTKRAKAAFGVLVAGQLFSHLGPTIRPTTPPAGASGKMNPAPYDDLPQCECSSVNDYCSWEYGSDWKCMGGGCYWGMNWGCGTFERYRCDGLCQETYGGG